MTSTNSDELRTCSEHVNIVIEYVCIEPLCELDRGPLCPACFTIFHLKCSDINLVHQDHLACKAELIKEGFPDWDLCEPLADILSSKVRNFKTQLSERANKSKISNSSNNKLSLNSIKELLAAPQSQCSVSFDPKTQEITIKPKAKYSSQEIQAFGQHFSGSFAYLVHNYKTTFAAQKRKYKQRLFMRELGKPDYLKIKPSGNAFEIALDVEQNKEAYLVYKKPLEEGSIFKIKIDSIDPDDRYLDIGVFDSDFYDSVTDFKYENGGNNSSAGFSLGFYGYDQHNLAGKYPATNKSDPKGFEPGTVIYFEYKNASVAIYNEDRSIDLVSESLVDTLPVYFYLFFFFAKTAVTLEKLR